MTADRIHLLSNGHLRCGIHPGHVSWGQRGLWPDDLRVTSNPDVTDCPECQARADSSPVSVSPKLAAVVEIVKKQSRGMTAADHLAVALNTGVTVARMRELGLQFLVEMALKRSGLKGSLS